MLRLAAILILLPVTALAGAWPRETGEVFLSFSVFAGAEDADDGYASAYAEYGAGPRLTLGLDIGGDEARMSKAFAFLRVPLGRQSARTLTALEFGIGTSDDRFALRPGLAFGRPITVGGYHGWLSLENRGIWREGGKTVFESDLTIGLQTGPGRKMMLQVQTYTPDDGATLVKLAPSFVFEIKPGRHLELGLAAGVHETDEVKFKLGIWRVF